jgi:4-hydroxy-tetrahydrodipicolinate synthase
MSPIAGLWVPIITPFNTDDQVDTQALRRLAGRLLTQGAAGLVALGTTGEPAVLSEVEQHLVVATLAEVCEEAGRPLMVGCGSNSTRHTIETVHRFAEFAASVLIVSPYYTRPSGQAIVEHYRVIAAESPVPVVAYNVPYRTGRGMSANELVEIASIPNVAGLKQATGALDIDTLCVLRDAPASFSLLAGDDAFIGPTILMGGTGAIAAAAHVCTDMFVALVSAALGNDVVATRRLAHMLLPVVLAGFAEPNPAVWKGALHRMGELTSASLRRPMTSASEESVTGLVAAARVAESDFAAAAHSQ